MLEARGGRLVSLPAAANEDDSSSGYPRKTTRPLTVVSPDGARAVCFSDDDGDDNGDTDDGGDGDGDHHGVENEPMQSLAADEEYHRLRSRLFLKYQVSVSVGDLDYKDCCVSRYDT